MGGILQPLWETVGQGLKCSAQRHRVTGLFHGEAKEKLLPHRHGTKPWPCGALGNHAWGRQEASRGCPPSASRFRLVSVNPAKRTLNHAPLGRCWDSILISLVSDPRLSRA